MIHKPMLLIPAFNPSESLRELIAVLRDKDPDLHTIIINDGSDTKHHQLFQSLVQLGNVTLLAHQSNLGKGAAIKTGLTYCQNSFPKTNIITADSDGQHIPSDILKIISASIMSPCQLIIGTRQLDKKIPFRSKFGNLLTRKVLNLLRGINLTDTQSGLRAIPYSFFPSLLNIKSNRYEFELEMLLYAKKERVQLAQIPIETIYLNNNESSHFRPILDSIRIYFRLLFG